MKQPIVMEANDESSMLKKSAKEIYVDRKTDGHPEYILPRRNPRLFAYLLVRPGG